MVVAVDGHLIPRYDRTRGDHLTISKYERQTKYLEWCITIHCANDGLFLAPRCPPVLAGASDLGMVWSLIDQCVKDDNVIKLCLVDREFFSVWTISALNELDIPYLMPCRNSPGVVVTIRKFAEGGRLNDTILRTLEGADGPVPSNMVIAARRRRDRNKSRLMAPEDRFSGFATSMSQADAIIYAVRCGIESTYARIEAMRVKTRSHNPRAHLFCFTYSPMVFNALVMARILLRSVIPGLSLPRRLGTITQLVFKEIIRALAEGPGPSPGGEPGP